MVDELGNQVPIDRDTDCSEHLIMPVVIGDGLCHHCGPNTQSEKPEDPESNDTWHVRIPVAEFEASCNLIANRQD